MNTNRVRGALFKLLPGPSLSARRARKARQQIKTRLRELSSEVDKSCDLGCGARPRNPFEATALFGVDLAKVSLENVVRADLAVEPIPFRDEEFDAISAFDFIEHIPRVSIATGKTAFPFIDLMSEIYRVLRPGGYFYSVTPYFPAKEAFQDPTHVNYITEYTFAKYFSGRNLAAEYGFRGRFELDFQTRVHGHLHTLLRKTGSD